MPIEEDLPRLYETYFTHSVSERRSRGVHLREAIKEAYWRAQYGYAGLRSPLWPVLAALVRLWPGLRAQADLQVFKLSARQRGRLLDVGCGAGDAMQRMKKLGWLVEGVDFDENAVLCARSKGLEVRIGSLEQQCYPEDTFDAIVMSHVLEHLSNPRSVLRECRRILKPGGQLVLTTPNALSWCHNNYKKDWIHLDPPRHLHIFTPTALRQLSERLGWSTLDVTTTIANTHWAVTASKPLRYGDRFDPTSRTGLYDAISSRLVQLLVAAKYVAAPDIGEELILRAVQ
jgi:2-polyprenyl-3-methyl-5-hydroxy-6-metoxy-1,4-benzoquinol methylase